jgi:methionyl-tRNA formyltransferase
VYTQPPRPAGRGKKIKISPIGQFARENKIDVFHPENFSSDNDINDFQSLNADLVFVIAYGLLLPQELLKAAKIGFFNVHASILPRWRGAAPIQRALLSGDIETGVCIIKLEASLDTGPIVFKRRLKIKKDDNTGSLHERLSYVGAELAHELCRNFNSLQYITQETQGVTYARKIQKIETWINWDVSASSVDRQIRAFAPVPGAWFQLDGERIKILESRVGDGIGVPGQIIDSHLQVACKIGSIFPTILQRSGRSPLSKEEFLRGYKVSPGMSLS